MEWYEPEDPSPRAQCPCCGYVSLPERGMSLKCDDRHPEDEFGGLGLGGLDPDDFRAYEIACEAFESAWAGVRARNRS